MRGIVSARTETELPLKLTDGAEAAYRKQDYTSPKPSIEGVSIVELKRFGDDGGSMTELARLEDGRLLGMQGFSAAQINYSTLEPGAIKAFHLHRFQTDVWYVPAEDRVLLVLADLRQGSRTSGARLRIVLGDSRSLLVRIPPGVAHGCRNLGASTARIVYFTDRHFAPAPDETDEGRLPWDFLGADLWERTRE